MLKVGRLLLYLKEVEKFSGIDSNQSQILPETSRGKKDSTRNAIKDITSDSQVNSYFPYRSGSNTVGITFKESNKIAADDNFILFVYFFYFYVSKQVRLDVLCEYFA